TPKHSAHSPNTVRIHYRWNPLFGQDLILQRIAKFPRGDYAFCELPDGTIAGLPACMIDPTVCGSIELGNVMASAEALSELHNLLDRSSRVAVQLEKIPVEA